MTFPQKSSLSGKHQLHFLVYNCFICVWQLATAKSRRFVLSELYPTQQMVLNLDTEYSQLGINFWSKYCQTIEIKDLAYLYLGKDLYWKTSWVKADLL